MRVMGFNVFKQKARRLLTKTEDLDDGTVAIDIAVVQVIEQCATLSYKLCQRTCCSIIFTVLLYTGLYATILGSDCASVVKSGGSIIKDAKNLIKGSLLIFLIQPCVISLE